ncbi:MAG: phosphotransferase family protein [Acidobacteriota bacterium]|nr:phosphotransferase family protein [Acidobacteriota bacterium]
MTPSDEHDVDPVDLVDRSRLRDFLEPLVGLGPDLTIEVLSGGRSNLTYLLRSGSAEYVLRRRPIGAEVKGAHDMAREFRVQQALQATAVPLARVYGFCADETVMGAPFYAMSRVAGSVFHRRSDVADLSAEQSRALSEAVIDTLDILHRVDYAAVGLRDLGRPEGFVRRRIGRWLEQYRSGRHRDHDLIEPLGERLAASIPSRNDSTLIHGDFRLGNMIVRADSPAPVTAVLDWEMSTLGDPLTDLAHLLVYWDRTCGRLTHDSQSIAEHAGFLHSEDLVARYQARSGRDLTPLPFYLAFEHWRAAIIKEGIYQRALRSGEAEGVEMGATVAVHLEEAAEILGS